MRKLLLFLLFLAGFLVVLAMFALILTTFSPVAILLFILFLFTLMGYVTVQMWTEE
jgi:hypothetical protein